MTDTSHTAKADRRALLRKLLQERGPAEGAADRTIPRRTGTGPAPLSFAQERLWFLDQYYPGSPLYNIPTWFSVPGSVGVGAVEAVLNEIVARHEILRTTFRVMDGQPRQLIAPSQPVAVPLLDLRYLPVEERMPAALAALEQDGRQPFDLTTGPLLRARLVRVSDAQQMLLTTMHHILSDGWSAGVFKQELDSLVAARHLGRRADLPSLPIQYADFAAWQRERLSGDRLEAPLSYWRERLRDVPAVIALPTDRPRMPHLSFRGATERFVLSRPASERMRALADRKGMTLFMVLLAAYKTWLFRYAGQPSVAVGCPTACRNRTELEGLIGFFVNTVVMHTAMSAELPFEDVLERVRETALAAFAHEDLPFEKLVEEVQTSRIPNVNPLFQVAFDFYSAERTLLPHHAHDTDALTDEELLTRLTVVQTGTAKFDLTLSMQTMGHRLGGVIEYSTDLFDAATIRRMIGHLVTLVEAASTDPRRAIGRLPLMPDHERAMVMHTWNATRRAFPERCLHQQFEARVDDAPDAVAVVCGHRRLTYRELDGQANQLSHALIGHGIRRGDVVGICMEGSPDLVTAVLAVLKAGGTYLPIDPSYPPARQQFMLDDAQAALLLVHEGGRGRFAALPIPKLSPDAATGEDAHRPGRPCSPDDPAYVIYTSGSTGRPKGVVIQHRGVSSLVAYLNPLLSIRPGKQVLQFSSFSFDVSVREIFETLLGGATLHVAPRDEMMPGEPLLELMRRGGITTVTLAPSIWAHLPYADLTALDTGVAGGEALPQDVVDRWAPGRAFFNGYGPTETTVASSVVRSEPAAGKPSIGGPLANTRYFIVDAEMEPCVIGKPGELLIGGVGLALGYLRRPALAAERFIPDPFSGEPGARLYRTGDLARWLPDGNVDYLGRIDHQVKVRGFRIELGEIEAALLAHPEVSAAVVACFETSPVDRMLVGYVVPAPNTSVAAEALRVFLAGRLPDYMIPVAFVVLDELPHTAAGKVDRTRLRPPHLGRGDEGYVAPRHPLETVLAKIWQEVLGAERIGIYDNFFELGGHSLLVTRITARIRDELRVEVPIRRLFESPTVAELAVAMSQDPAMRGQVDVALAVLAEVEGLDDEAVATLLSGADADAGAGPAVETMLDAGPVALARDGAVFTAPLSFAQERLWFLHELEPDSIAYNIVAPFPIPEPVDVPALEAALAGLVARHESLRTTFPASPDGTQPVQRIAPGSSVTLDVEDLRTLPDAQASARLSAVLATRALEPYDLARGPLMRPTLVRRGDHYSVLVLAMHHIVSDAWSIQLLGTELPALYAEARSGRAAGLPGLPVQCADHAVWQRARLTGARLDDLVSFWRAQLEHAPRQLPLPTDRGRPAVPSFRGATVGVELGAHQTQALEALGRQEGATVFMVMLAAFSAVLGRWSGEQRIPIGAPISNRGRKELEGVVGLLTNTVVLCANLEGDPTFRELLRRARETTLAAYEHQELPFEKLVEAVSPARSLNVNPLFQVMLVVQQHTGLFDVVGGPAHDHDGVVAKFDATLYLEQTPSGLAGSIEYSTDLFYRSTIERLAGHLRLLVAEVVADPDLRLSALSTVDPAERAVLERAWTPSARDREPVESASLVLARRMAQSPAALALVHADETLTFSELDHRVNALAAHLKVLGGGPDVAIGVYLERGTHLVSALLAILRIGATFLPLDPALPPSRIDFVLDDAHAPIVVTRRGLTTTLERHRRRLAVIEEIPGRGPAMTPVTGQGPQAAYIAYTSGSTGAPKGAVVTRGVLDRLVAWQVAASPIGEGGRTLQFAPPCFDVFIQEVLSTLCAGGTLVIEDDDRIRDVTGLPELVRRQQIHRVFLPYVALQCLAEVLSAGRERKDDLPLREVITAGEQLKITPAIRDLFRSLPGCGLANQYGPSETHVVSEHVLDGPPDAWPDFPPIGRPVAAARLYVLDEFLRPSPLGVAGELFIAGESVGRGYLGRPQLTAQRFLPDPLSPLPGARMYATGDSALIRPDGQMIFLGRLDQQLKIDGYRIEPGEIEANLLKHPAVAEAVVIGHATKHGPAALVAYVQPTVGSRPSPHELRQFLAASLPPYAIPAAYVLVDAIPRTPTGKIDRRSLPSSAGERATARERFVAPRTEMEAQIAAIWSEVLEVAEVGVQDNFFELGGASLIATRIISRMETLFGIRLPLRSLFERPTVEALASEVMRLREESST